MNDWNRDPYPLHTATKEGDVDEVNRLIAKGEEVNKPNDCDERALHFAAEHAQTLIALALIKAGADLNLCNRRQMTALDVAIKEHKEDSVIVLFLRGVMEKPPKTNQEQANALLWELELQEMMDSPLHGEFIRKLLVALGIAK